MDELRGVTGYVVMLAYQKTAQLADQRTVEIPMAPPRRLMQSLRFRSSKIRYDADVWGMCMEGVNALLAEGGWRVAGVHVEWGQRIPETRALRERVTRELTRCGEGCELTESYGQPGKGETRIDLERER